MSNENGGAGDSTLEKLKSDAEESKKCVFKYKLQSLNSQHFSASLTQISHEHLLLRLGNEAFATRKFDEAIAHYNNAIKNDPSNAVYYSNRR